MKITKSAIDPATGPEGALATHCIGHRSHCDRLASADLVLALSTWSAPSPNGFSEAMRLGAFRALEDLGLVQIEQNCGAFVRKIDLDEAVEIHHVYSALEELEAR